MYFLATNTNEDSKALYEVLLQDRKAVRSSSDAATNEGTGWGLAEICVA